MQIEEVLRRSQLRGVMAAALAQAALVLYRWAGGSIPLELVGGLLFTLLMGLLIWRRWVANEVVNALAGSVTAVWVLCKIILCLWNPGEVFEFQNYFVVALGVLMAVNWLPARWGLSLAALQIAGMVLVIRLRQPADTEMMLWACFLDVMVIFATLYGQQIVTARLRSQVLTQLVRTDPLTAVLNRRGGWQQLEALEQAGQGGAVLLIDIDRFKQINDTLGHATGDEMLTRLADELTRLTSAEQVSRWGGEEFLVLLPGQTLAGAYATAQTILQAARNIALPTLQPPHLSLSIGLSSLDEGQGDALLRLTDERMYAAKRSGGQRICGPAGADAAGAGD